MELSEFRKKVLRAEEKKHHFNITNSNGTKEAWRWIKKNKWLDIGCPITELQFGKIIKAINLTLQDKLLEGKDVSFPNRMGRLEIRKFKAKIEYIDNKVVTTLPVNWKETLKLWWEDEEAHKNKTLVRHEGSDRFAIYFNREYANFANKSFYKFMPTRSFRKKLRDKIVNEGFDALLLGKKNELY